ncbi:MAG: phasin family protein [Burkholderiales bacterium]|nr:phasin family protein [Burkholderiales bacterium]
MARKAAAAPVAKTASKKKTAKSAPKPAAKAPAKKAASRASAFPAFDPAMMANMGDLSKMAKMMTPEQAMDMYRANARMALDVINAAIENTTKLRRLQFEGEEQARAMSRKAARRAVEAASPDEIMAAGQDASQEAMEQAMRYWGQMFDMIVEMQKRLFVMMEGQMAGVPGAKEAKAAMSMMPDLRQAQNIIQAMQGVVSSGGNAFESMQRVMGDFARFVPGMKRP